MKKKYNDNTLNGYTQEELDNIEYITQRKHKKEHVESEEDIQKKLDETLDFVYAKPYKKKKSSKNKMNRGLKISVIIVSIIAGILVLCVATLAIFNLIGRSAMHDYDDMNIEPSKDVSNINSISNDGKTIVYNGKTYHFNEDVSTVVMMGIDTGEVGFPTKVVGTSGQADAIYIAAIDEKNSKVSVLGVSRDTITDVNIYNQEGGFVGTQPMQICLSYAYGDGQETSCENTLVSLERLFFGMEFNTYFSINKHALATLNDTIGGVTVTTDAEFYSTHYDRVIKAGETVTLYGEDASKYIRTRDLDELDSNTDRMKRQKTYMQAFLKQAWSSIKSDPSIITDMLKSISYNSTTNLNAAKTTYLATTALSNLDSYKDVEFLDLTGEVKEGEYAEFYPDQTKLMETMLDLFYLEEK